MAAQRLADNEVGVLCAWPRVGRFLRMGGDSIPLRGDTWNVGDSTYHSYIRAQRDYDRCEALLERATVPYPRQGILQCEVGHPGVELGAPDGCGDVTRAAIRDLC